MKAPDYIRLKINKLPKGYVFTYEDFISEVKSKEAIIKALNRMSVAGEIVKLSKGKFYKAEKTIFGNLLPDQQQIVKDLLEKDGVVIGYITGYSIYNQLGLSTQVGNIIHIGRNTWRPPTQRGYYKIEFVKQKNNITKENIPLLQILDAIKNIKKIPDTTVSSSCSRLVGIIEELTEKDVGTMVRLAKKYTPATRATLGAILEYVEGKVNLQLKGSLNPITIYRLTGVTQVLPNAGKWNIQ